MTPFTTESNRSNNSYQLHKVGGPKTARFQFTILGHLYIEFVKQTKSD